MALKAMAKHQKSRSVVIATRAGDVSLDYAGTESASGVTVTTNIASSLVFRRVRNFLARNALQAQIVSRSDARIVVVSGAKSKHAFANHFRRPLLRRPRRFKHVRLANLKIEIYV